MPKDFSVFPFNVQTILKNDENSYLTPYGVATRHPSGAEELLVSYPHFSAAFPEHYILFPEGFRNQPDEVAIEAVQETEASTIIDEVQAVAEEENTLALPELVEAPVSVEIAEVVETPAEGVETAPEAATQVTDVSTTDTPATTPAKRGRKPKVVTE